MKNTMKLLGGALVLWFGLAPVAMAKGLSYSYAEAGYYLNDTDFEQDGDGFHVDMSFAAHDYVNIRASYLRAYLSDYREVDGQDVDMDEFGLGFGVHYPVLKWLDVVAGAVGVVQIFSNDKNNNEEGYRADVGVRVQPMKKVELHGGYLYQDIFEGDRHGFTAGFLVDITKQLSAGVRMRQTDADDLGDEAEYFGSVRLRF